LQADRRIGQGTVLIQKETVSHRPEFFDGRVLHWRMVSDVMLGEIVYVPGAVRETHMHERACLHLNLQGGYIERIGSRAVDCTELAVAFQPAGHEHSYRCHNVATRSFTVEFEKAWLDRLQEAGISPRPELFADSRILHLALRLHTEYGIADSASPLSVEGLLLEILAVATRRWWRTGAKHQEPHWLSQVENVLRARFMETLRLDDLAAEVRVHPVHLARTFRAYRGLTIGSFLRQLRVSRACFLLGEGDLPLAQLASDLGFSDQSQFTRTFRRATGVTPGQYRREFARGSR
jgi:AraC family transcriptional regulator